MRAVTKAYYPFDDLDNANLPSPPSTKEEATDRWGAFNSGRTFKKLFIEQYGLCIYSEINIQDFQKEHSSLKGAHIEHLEPKSSNPERTFDYFNLSLSALDAQDLEKFRRDEVFGGHYKLGFYDEKKFLNPCNNYIGHYFSFSTESGEVYPNIKLNSIDRQKVQYTIELLNLNSNYLKNLRKNWLKELADEIDKLIDANSLNAIEEFAKCELLPFQRDFTLLPITTLQLRPFHNAVTQLFGKIGEKVLIVHAEEFQY
ncbi:TIGR02646 family protein [Pseudoalteromonas sp. S1609]|uniref:retron system putative HNH endonuclease n=1 Tax=Pseudoalteromonas sp. S1609 TaxID=579505 RepID=UPI00110B9D8E|nr:retron system putative HNH endonuclease [Pseudoalteromonas sp. S1609]TMP72738.1 TIGR02646 family protein [Pseudoalteromonas sp. S1609]